MYKKTDPQQSLFGVETQLSQSLRSRQDPQMTMVRAVFEKISKNAINKLGLSTGEQRVDSTHIVSNICTRGRMDLFHKTIDHFIKSLDKGQFMRVPRHIQKWYQREAQGWFGMRPVQHKDSLIQLAKHLDRLIVVFKTDPVITAGEPYRLLVRLFNEQCEIVKTGKGKGKQVKVKKSGQGQSL